MRHPFATAVTLLGLAVAPVAPVAAVQPARADQRVQAPRATQRLTNLAHLDFLGDRVRPVATARHTTYQLAGRPSVGVLWTYAEHQPDGSFERVGGGTYDAASNTYGQGAFNADDMARAAVVYVRDWQQTGAAASRTRARELLRGLTYLQTATGSHRGDVVLWMQPDGTLNRSADPVEQPDPSDSDASYWLARTVWALGEAYPAYRRQDPGFARFLKQRLDLAVGALDRQVLGAYGRYLHVDGRRTPAWLVVDEAGASAEAVLGLASYVEAGGTPEARRTLRQLSDGIAALGGGSARQWPFGGVLPGARSRSSWHAWSSQMPAALARAGRVLHVPHLVRVAARDSFTFDPWLITSGGPDNGRSPARADAGQIAYGVDSRVQSLLATGGGAKRLAGVVAAWYFGANASHSPTYDPATGVTVDGVAPDGTVNQNSGAESTIHGLLTMLALDAHPVVRRIARARTVESIGTRTLQAEDARLGGGASAVVRSPLGTAEASYSGTGFAALPSGGTATFDLGDHPRSLVIPVVDLRRGSSAVVTVDAGPNRVGTVRVGRIGASADSAAPGALLPRTLPEVVRPVSRLVTVSARSRGGDVARVDALLVQPLVSRLVLLGHGHGTAVLRSAARRTTTTTVTVPGTGPARTWAYDGLGRLLEHRTSSAFDTPVTIAPGGVTVVRR